MEFQVYRADGTEVMPGDVLTNFRGKSGTKYLGCKHPRKIMTDEIGCEKYPSVYNVEIRHNADGYVWNPVSDEGRRMWEARPW